MSAEAAVDDLTKLFLAAQEVDFQRILVFFTVYESEVLRDLAVIDEPSHG